jgi:hypothetical protein
MNISIHIERLILDGLPIARGQAPLVQAALEAELARLLAEGGVAADLLAGGMVPSLSPGSIRLTGAGDPVQVGQQIARAVYGGIGA